MAQDDARVGRMLHWRPTDLTPGVGAAVFPVEFFDGSGSVNDFLASLDDNISFYNIPEALQPAYLRNHLTGRALRDRTELEAEYYGSKQRSSQSPTAFILQMLKVSQLLNFVVTEVTIVQHTMSRLAPNVLDYVELRNPTTKAQLLEVATTYESRHASYNPPHRQENYQRAGYQQGNSRPNFDRRRSPDRIQDRRPQYNNGYRQQGSRYPPSGSRQQNYRRLN
ncbi:hypothetical protein NPIL_365061 [Nephila pilipes]|uniref:Uncharacterized protein n=1 Tax=Nephila pilipes TaxID=299642 RepID=A0A8X6USB4_NEPPI|nr:hypothetical protein NPIL_365061 [Nephila pilipes]